MPRTPALPLWLALALAGCGGTPPEGETTPAADDTAGAGGDSGTEADPTEAELMLDPCAEDEGEEPCATGGVDSEEGALTEAGGSEGEEAGQSGDAEETGGDTEGGGEDPRVAWRNQVGAGRAVFDRVCGVCHPGGEEDLGPDIRRKRISVARMRTLIRNGQGRMRPIPARRLPDRYMDDLMAYLSTLGTVRGVQRPQ